MPGTAVGTMPDGTLGALSSADGAAGAVGAGPAGDGADEPAADGDDAPTGADDDAEPDTDADGAGGGGAPGDGDPHAVSDRVSPSAAVSTAVRALARAVVIVASIPLRHCCASCAHRSPTGRRPRARGRLHVRQDPCTP
jgi:hypothetical protein